MSAAADHGDPLIGQEVIGYRIVRAIGSGGMGAVYEAVHESIGQRAAVKVLFPEFSKNAMDVQRFVTEARAASQVVHPGLVKIFNHGRLHDGTAYIMMEFLLGESLQARIDRLEQASEQVGVAFVLRFGRQVASALAAVHAQGIVHRDLKPGNVILVPNPDAPDGEQAKIVDFGIAKVDSTGATSVAQTTVGRFLGTALYASPEQCEMSGQIGTQSDVYSLGIVLYELLAGRPPFLSGHAGVVIGMHLFQKPRPLWELAPKVPAQLCRLVHEMLAKEPGQRPTMADVHGRLEQIRAETPPMHLWAHRRVRTIAILALPLLVSSGIGMAWMLRRGSTKTGVGSAARESENKAPPVSFHAADGGDVGRAETVGSKVEPSLHREPAGPGNLAPAKNQVSQSKKSPDKSSLMNRGTHRTVFSPKPITSQPPSTPASSKSIELPAEPAPPPAKKRRNAEEDGFY